MLPINRVPVPLISSPLMMIKLVVTTLNKESNSIKLKMKSPGIGFTSVTTEYLRKLQDLLDLETNNSHKSLFQMSSILDQEHWNNN